METINDLSCNYLNSEYKSPTRSLSIEEIFENKNHNIIMIDIAHALNYAEFDEVKSCTTTYDMWIKLKAIYGGDDNITRTKAKNLRGKFDQMKMREDENIAKYVERIKANVSAIKASKRDI